jgi:hypothetical protein
MNQSKNDIYIDIKPKQYFDFSDNIKDKKPNAAFVFDFDGTIAHSKISHLGFVDILSKNPTVYQEQKDKFNNLLDDKSNLDFISWVRSWPIYNIEKLTQDLEKKGVTVCFSTATRAPNYAVNAINNEFCKETKTPPIFCYTTSFGEQITNKNNSLKEVQEKTHLDKDKIFLIDDSNWFTQSALGEGYKGVRVSSINTLEESIDSALKELNLDLIRLEKSKKTELSKDQFNLMQDKFKEGLREMLELDKQNSANDIEEKINYVFEKMHQVGKKLVCKI